MAPIYFSIIMLDSSVKQSLSALANASIEYGSKYQKPKPVDISEYQQTICQPGACFVTLKKQGKLRGCIGSIEAVRPLVEDVAENAYAAAFRDPRFPRLQSSELAEIIINLSVLGQPESLIVDDVQELYTKLRPGVDGLILIEGSRRATFLPAVWESLPEPTDFVAHLRRKAGLNENYWSPTIQFQRYVTESWTIE